MPDNNEIQTSKNLGKMLTRRLNINDGFDILERNPKMLEYQKVNGKDEVIIHSTVGKLFQGSNKPKICKETEDVKNLLEEFYSSEPNVLNPNVIVIPSENVTKLCSPPSGGSKSRRRKTHNKRASRSKSKTQRRRRARMSRK